MNVINLGDRCVDKITGFRGVVTGHCQYISGCDQILLQPRVKDDGDAVNGRWFDIDRCEVVEAGAVSIDSVSSVKRPGADSPAPIK